MAEERKGGGGGGGDEGEGEPMLPPSDNPEALTPAVEVRLYRRGRGPVAVFKSRLGGYCLDQLEVGEILEAHGLKSVYAFDPSQRRRAAAVRFHPRNGRSLMSYVPGSVVVLDGEPKDPLVKPLTKALVGIAIVAVILAVVFRERPEWLDRARAIGGNFPPWVLALVVIVFTRLRKRTRDVLKKFGHG